MGTRNVRCLTNKEQKTIDLKQVQQCNGFGKVKEKSCFCGWCSCSYREADVTHFIAVHSQREIQMRDEFICFKIFQGECQI